MFFFQHQNDFCKKYATGLISGLLFFRDSRTSYTRVGEWKKNRLSPSRKQKARLKRRCSAGSCIFFKAMSTLSSLKNLTRKLEVSDEGRPTARQLQANVGFFNNDLMTARVLQVSPFTPPSSAFFLLPTRLFRTILHYLSLWYRLATLRNCITPGFILMIQYKDFLLRNKIISVL